MKPNDEDWLPLVWFTNTSIVCETDDQSFTEALQKRNLSSVWQSSSRLWRNDSAATFVQAECSCKFGDCKTRMMTFLCKTRRNIKLSLKIYESWLFICSSSVSKSHVRLCCCSKEDDLVQNISALLWKDCVWVIERWITSALTSSCVPKGFLHRS